MLYKNKTSSKSEVERIMNVFFSQPDQSIEQHLAFSFACAAAWRKLNVGATSEWLRFKILSTKNVSQYLKYQPEFVGSTERSNATQILQNIASWQTIHQKLAFLLIFIPVSSAIVQLERIISNERRPSTITTWPYLLIIKGYPEDLQIYLIEYVHLFVDVKTEIANSIKEKFLAVIIKWMTNC
ncbi:unnamed protein product [Rotaria sp. Silwood1]|nr:unnamed protein product [Rotaria sp. Silwood1]CAF1631614.1 unnamed protein product [Rotaria sp. Silwood1]